MRTTLADEARLLALLLDAGLVSKGVLSDAAREAAERGTSIGDVLTGQGVLSADELRRIEARILGLPFVSLVGRRIERNALLAIPEPVARSCGIVAFERTPQEVRVACLDASGARMARELLQQEGVAVRLYATDSESLRTSLLSYQRFLKDEFGGALRAGGTGEGAGTATDALIRHALLQQASDIHVEVRSETLVRYRLHGSMHDALTLPAGTGRAIAASLKEIAGLPPTATGPRYGRFCIRDADGDIDVACASLATQEGERIHMRIHRHGAGASFEMLGLWGEPLERLHGMLRERAGLILVAGGAHSGKTTLLYALIDALNTPSRSLAAVEEHPERSIPRVHQVRVQGSSAADAVRALVRQDVDVIMVSDVRDAETAQAALSAALSGRMVIVGIDAPSASAALTFFARAGDPLALRSALLGALGTRLLPAMDPSSRTSCTGLFEVLSMSRALRALLEKGATAEDIERQAKAEGMATFADDLEQKAALGLVSLEE